MKFVRSALSACALAAALSVAACSQPSQQAEAPPPAASEAPPAAAPPAATAEAPAQVVTVSVGGLTGSSDAGQKVFRQCMSCHVVEPGVNRVGPSLHGIIGRTAGTVPGFKYSEANKNSGEVWTEEELFKYLENPQAVIPGTIMAFAGLKNPQDRADVIAYLKANSPS